MSRVELPRSNLENQSTDTHSNNLSMVGHQSYFPYIYTTNHTDPVFKSSNQIEFNTQVIASADNNIKACEAELSTLKEITADGGDDKLGVNGSSWLGMGKHSAIKERAKWLLEKMGKNVEKLGKLEKENEDMLKVLSDGRA